jgi:hypothetical protein
VMNPDDSGSAGKARTDTARQHDKDSAGGR